MLPQSPDADCSCAERGVMKNRLVVCRRLCAQIVLLTKHNSHSCDNGLGAELSEGSVAGTVGIYWASGVTSVCYTISADSVV